MASHAEAGPEDAAGLAENFRSLRQEVLTLFLGGIGVILWVWIATYLARRDAFWPGLGLPLGLLLAIGVCFALKDRHSTISSLLLLASLFVGAAFFYVGANNPLLAPFPFVAVVLIAGVLNGPRAAFTVAALVTVAVVASGAVAKDATPTPVSASTVALAWLAWLASWATTRSLYTALRWAWSYSELAERNLEETQRHRGLLAGALAQLEQANYRLERANYALAWARAEADQARRLKAQFAAHVSHELRTPINLVVGFSDLLLDHPEAYGGVGLDPAHRSDLSALQRSARHLQALVDDILDLSQIDAGEMPIIKDLTEVGAIVNEAVATARPLLNRKGLAVKVEISPDLPMLQVDRLRIRQVLLNLLNNASRFTDRGGVTVRASLRNAEVLIEVEDSGRGIAPASLPRLFEPYRQLATSAEEREDGTGLGLSIAKRFVELHGGRIWARSDGVPDRGSTFVFALPLQAGDVLAAEDPGGEFRARRTTVTNPPDPAVVVLAPDPAAVGIFQRRLQRYRVVGASNVDEAIQLSRTLGAHAILADGASMNGAGLRPPPWSDLISERGLRVLFCPMPSPGQIERALGVAQFLIKPITREALLDAVRATGPTVRTVLIVDDHPNMVRLLARMLRSAPERYDVLRAFGGEEALEVLKRRAPDLILLDLLMPRIDGLAFLGQMRSDPTLATIPVIAISAQTPGELLAPATENTVALVSGQPLPLNALARSVQALLDSLPPEAGGPATGQDSPGGLPG